MSEQIENPSERPVKSAAVWIAVAALLAAYLCLALTSVARKCLAYDEMAHLPGGYSYWIRNDYRLHPENGNLPQRWMALGLLAGNYRFPSTDNPDWRASNVWGIGNQFFYEEGNDLEGMLFRGRAAIAVLGASLALVVYLWSRRLFGTVGGLVSLALCVFSPTLLAHGQLMTSEMASALCFVGSLACLWTVLHRISLFRVLGSAVVTGALFLSKMSAPLIVLAGLGLVVVRLSVRRPLLVTIGGRREVTGRGRQALLFAVTALVHVIVVYALIWAAFGFRFSAFRTAEPGKDRLDRRWEPMAHDDTVGKTLDFARRHRLLPEAYLYGNAHIYHYSRARWAFLNGHYSQHGWWSFFPYCFLVKTPLSVFVLLVLAAAAAVWKRQAGQAPGESSTQPPAWKGLYGTAPLWIFLLVYWGAAVTSSLNIGHRHLLPVYPVTFILAGASAAWFRTRLRWVQALTAAAVLALAVESVLTWPHYLAYFNQLVGGPRNGYRHLVDSSLDWGQDLPGLRRWLDARGLNGPGREPVYISYFGVGSLKYYDVKGFLLPALSGFPQQGPRRLSLTGGVYCISATMLQTIHLPVIGHWRQEYESEYQTLKADVESYLEARRKSGSRGEPTEAWASTLAKFNLLQFERLCAHLRTREPDDHVGYSILIYRLTDADVHRALEGPVEELERTR